MIKETEVILSPEESYYSENYPEVFSKKTSIPKNRIKHFEIIRKSLDARRGAPRFIFRIKLWIDETPQEKYNEGFKLKDVAKAHKKAIIVGTGPAGLFAALTLIENGIKPIIVERGKSVDERKHDIARLYRENLVNPDSNYCFGEGGAGTYSDGKLYTRSNKRGNIRKILETLVQHGAKPSLLYEAHPHIGTDKLPNIISNIRKSIINSGGEIFFNERICEIKLAGNRIVEIISHSGKNFSGDGFILATGHSARDIYQLLYHNQIELEAKPFALGVRVEHPQELINKIQYKSFYNNPYLEAASYSLVYNEGNRGVFSFCMCPGGIIVPAATNANETVVNGMSNSRRNSPFANSGIVVSVGLSDFSKSKEPNSLVGIEFQASIEAKAHRAVGMTLKAPAQRLTDFLNSTDSLSLPASSYHIGLVPYNLHEIFPEFITTALKNGFKAFDRKMKGFITEEAIVVGTESRTSSPVRIPRTNNYNHIRITNLFPCGEGAGYAGGITSSAIDGCNAAEALVKIFA